MPIWNKELSKPFCKLLKRSWRRWPSFIAVLFLSAGCSSGKTNAGPASTPSIVAENLYTGPVTQAPIGTSALGEALQIIFGESLNDFNTAAEPRDQQILQPINAFKLYAKDLKKSLLETKYAKTRINETENCEGGGVIKVAGEIADTGSGTLDMEYGDCVLDGVMMTGALRYLISEFDQNGGEIIKSSIQFNRIEMKYGDDAESRLSGSIDFESVSSYEGALTYNMDVLDKKRGKSYRFHDYTIRTDESHSDNAVLTEEHSGILYLDRLGFVWVHTDGLLSYSSLDDQIPSDGILRIRGAADDELEFDFSDHKAIIVEAGITREHYLMDEEMVDPLMINLWDQDKDGMHDSFEIYYGLSITTDDGGDNADGDLFTNVEEYRRRTDVTDPTSPEPPELKLTYRLEFFRPDSAVLVQDGELYTPFTIEERIPFFLRLREAIKIRPDVYGSTVNEIEKLEVELVLPDGFELSKLSSEFGECSVEMRKCAIQRVDSSSFHRLLNGELYADKTAKNGVFRLAAKFEGFFDQSIAPIGSDNSIVLGKRIDDINEALNERGTSPSHLNRIILEPDVYWGSFELMRGSAELIGGEGENLSSLYLTSSIGVRGGHFRMSGFNVFGSGQRISLNDRSEDIVIEEFERKMHLSNNNFYNVSFFCDFGKPIFSENRFYGSFWLEDGENCHSLTLYNNVFREQTPSGALYLRFADFSIYNNHFIDSALNFVGILPSSGAGRITNNLFVNDANTVVIQLRGEQSVDILQNNAFAGSSIVSVSGSPINATEGGSNIGLDVSNLDGQMEDPIMQGSPLIDAGSGVLYPTIDLTGGARPIDGDGDGMALPDIGAFEFRP